MARNSSYLPNKNPESLNNQPNTHPPALSVDIIDASGTAESDVNFARGAHLHKTRLDARGAQVGRGAGSDYQTPQSQRMFDQGGSTVVNVDLGAAMKHMDEMEAEMGAHEGCRLHGDVTVRRVAGRLHFAVHQQNFVDLLPQMLTGHVLPRVRNISHTVHRVSFGPSFPGQVNPLDGTQRIEPPGSGGHAYKYYIKVGGASSNRATKRLHTLTDNSKPLVSSHQHTQLRSHHRILRPLSPQPPPHTHTQAQIVPTEYTTRMGSLLETSQYSVSEYAMPLLPLGATGHGKKNPFVDLVYDLSPIVMHIHQSPLSMLHFVVRLCAVVGGALSVTRLCDGLVHGAVGALGLAEEDARCSSGGGSSAGSHRGGAGRLSFGEELLPTRSSHGGSSHGSGAGHRTSQAGGLLRDGLAGLGGSLLRHSSSSGGAGSGGGGGMLPTHTGSGGGAAGSHNKYPGGNLAMSPLSGFAPPVLTGFGSWSQLDHGENHKKH